MPSSVIKRADYKKLNINLHSDGSKGGSCLKTVLATSNTNRFLFRFLNIYTYDSNVSSFVI